MLRKVLTLFVICIFICGFCIVCVDAKTSSYSKSSYSKSYTKTYTNPSGASSYSRTSTYIAPKVNQVNTQKAQTYTRTPYPTSAPSRSTTVVNHYTTTPVYSPPVYSSGGMGILDYLLINQMFNNHQQQVVQQVPVQQLPGTTYQNITYVEPTPTQESPIPVPIVILGIIGSLFVIRKFN